MLHIAAGSLNQTPLDWNGNYQRILSALKQAREKEVGILCLPELCVSGYGCEDAFLSASTQRISLELVSELLDHTADLAVNLGLPLLIDGHLYNASCLLADKQVLGVGLKRALPKDGIHYEPRWFRPWVAGQVSSVRIAGSEVPVGDLVYDCAGIRIGFEICEDAWIAERPARSLAASRVDVVLNPSASHFAFGKAKIRESIVTESSRAFSCTYVYANALGNEAGRIIYDGDSLIASNGSLLTRSQRFSFSEVNIISATVDIEAQRQKSLRRAETEGAASASEHQLIQSGVELRKAGLRAKSTAVAAWEQGRDVKEHEFTRAVALGLFDYLRKSRSSGFVVSLSGGADSSATACLVALAVQFAIEELGLEQFRSRLSHVGALVDADSVSGCVRTLLTCVYQASEHSSKETEHAARELASELNAQFYRVSVSEVIESYTKLVESSLGEVFTWKQDDTVLQNIQARARGPLVWMIANKKNALLLATSNRSEAAVGYTTMDGDTCGGLSPIGGIDKAFLLSWIRWLHEGGCESYGPLAALAAVIALKPSAELRPAEQAQTDESDLMPYPILERIERLAIRDKLSPQQIFDSLQPDIPNAQLLEYLERFFHLWSINQWKRERYAPCFHLDDENLDPKTWCRFPILSGGFIRELAELREKVSQRCQ